MNSLRHPPGYGYYGGGLSPEDIYTIPRILAQSVVAISKTLRKASQHKMRVEDSPQLIIWTGEDGKLHVDEELLEELWSIDSPCLTIGITGMYRLGKSYIMNRIAGEQQGFATGPTVQRETKDIWIWVRDHPKKPGVKLILLDTEGLAEPSQLSSEHDNRVLVLATLLPSVVIYNTTGNVGKGVISDLSCLTELSRKLRNEDYPSDREHAPLLLVTLRDFSLQLEINGVEVTPDAYFEHVLNTTLEGPELQCPLESIKNFFPRRKCFVFDRPGSRAQLGRLSEIPDEKLSPDFQNEMRTFLEYIHEIPVPTFYDMQFKGSVLAGLIASYVCGINDGNVPSVETTFLSIIKGENEKLVKKCVLNYASKLRSQLILPVEDLTEIDRVHEVTFQECKELFLNICFGDEGTKVAFIEILKNAINDKHEEFRLENEKVSNDRCKEWLEQRGLELIMKIASGEYDDLDAANKLTEDFNQIKNDYFRTTGLGIKRETNWEWFEQDWVSIALSVKWKAIVRNAYLPWRENRENIIMSFIGIIDRIQGQNKKFRIGNITYSAAGILSSALVITGIALAPVSLGATFALSAVGAAGGVASGLAGGIHAGTKEYIIHQNIKRSRELLEEDQRLFELLQAGINELNVLVANVQRRLNGVPGALLSGALAASKAAGAIVRITYTALDIAVDFAKVTGRVMAPVAAAFAVVDAIIIGYNAKKLHEDELSGRAREIEEHIIELGDGLLITNSWFRNNVPDDMQSMIPI